MGEGERTQPISIRLEASVLDWFRAQREKGYQTLIKQVLREHVRQRQQHTMLTLSRAQELYRRYHARCFWHYRPDLQITAENLHLVVEGLRTYGGKQGYKLAAELCR